MPENAMTTSRRPLLFVNKTGSSQKLSKSGSGESGRILRHVQRNRRDAEGKRREPEWSKLSSTFVSSDKPDPENTAAAPGQATHTLVPPHSLPPSRTAMPMLYPACNAFDPFHCTAIGRDAETHSLLRYTLSDLARANFLAEAFAPERRLVSKRSLYETMRHQPIFELRLQRCVQDPMLMYATLAYSASFLGWTTGHFHHSKPPEYFVGKAIRAIRIRLAQQDTQIDDWLLLSMYALAITELWNGLPVMWTQHAQRRNASMDMTGYCTDASRMHLRALLQLVSQAGGWGRFSPYILESTILLDKYLAIASSQPPLMSPIWDPGPLSAKLRDRYGIARNPHPRLGIGFMAHPLNPELQADLRDLVDFSKTAHLMWSNGNVDPLLESWLFRRLQAINHRLLFKAFETHDNELQLADRCIALAALLFLTQCLFSRGPQLAAGHLARSFEISLRDASNQMPRDLRIWCLCMGALLPESSEPYIWYTSQLREELVGLETRDNFASILSSYLFLPERQGRALEELCSAFDILNA